MFRAPSTTCHYEKALEHIDEGMKTETPGAFGLHPNAEIGFRTQQSDDLISSILSLSYSANGLNSGSNDIMSSQHIAEGVIQDVQDSLRDIRFDVVLSVENVGLYQFVLHQECEYMNILLAEIMTSLSELNSCFKGNKK